MKTTLLLLSMLLVGCVTQSHAPPKPPVTLTDNEADVCEALLRHLFVRNASATQQSAGSYFIQIQNADPSDKFLARFAGQTPAVKRASEAKHARDSGVYDGANGKESLLFEIGAVHWRGKNTAEIEGGYYEGNMSSSSSTYRLVHTRNQWKVVEETMNWIAMVSPISKTNHRAKIGAL